MKFIRYSTRLCKLGYKGKYGYFFCQACESEVEKNLSNGKRDKTCGCFKVQKKHGYYGTDLYLRWLSIRGRCKTKSNHSYGNYGGRGIDVCIEWDTFLPFKEWAESNGYKKSLQIDRIDNDKGYSPDNCRFVTIRQNSMNRSTNKLNRKKVSEIRKKRHHGGHKMQKLADEYGVCIQTISNVVNNKSWIYEDTP